MSTEQTRQEIPTRRRHPDVDCASCLQLDCDCTCATCAGARQNDRVTQAPVEGASLAAPARSIKELRDLVSLLANFIWTGKLRPGEHLWTLPADPKRDFDCILVDAIDELEALRKSASSSPEGAGLAALQQAEAAGMKESDFWERKCHALEQRLAEVTRHLTEAQQKRDDHAQQLEVLRPGGAYAWKSKFEAAEATIATAKTLSADWLRRYTASLEYDKQHGLRDITTQLGGMAMAAEELDAALAAPAAGTPPQTKDTKDNSTRVDNQS